MSCYLLRPGRYIVIDIYPPTTNLILDDTVNRDVTNLSGKMKRTKPGTAQLCAPRKAKCTRGTWFQYHLCNAGFSKIPKKFYSTENLPLKVYIERKL